MSNERLIEKLVVMLSLNAKPYEKTEKEVAASTKKTAETVEKGVAKNDTNDKKRDRERIKRERAESARRRKEAQEITRRNSELNEQLVNLGRTAAGMFLGFETLKGAANLFNNYVTNTAAMGRSAENLGIGVHEFQTFGAAIKLAGGDAEAAKAQFASMQQAIFAATTRGERSPFVQTLATMGVYLRDARGQVKPLTELLNELADAMQKRGLNRAQAFQFLQGAGVGEDVANLLLAKNRQELLDKASKTSTINAYQTEAAADVQKKRENFKAGMAALGHAVGAGIDNLILGRKMDFDPAMSPDARKASHTGSMFLPALDEIGKAHGLPDGLLSAVAYQESHLDPDAVNKKSGARGIMQLMPNVFKGAGQDPIKDMETAATELQRLFKVFGTWEAALAAYNDGQGNIESLLTTGKRKNGQSGLPAETANYIANVIGPTPIAAANNPDHTNTVTTGPVTIQTNASTISGAAEDFSATLKRKMDVSQANTGMSY